VKIYDNFTRKRKSIEYDIVNECWECKSHIKDKDGYCQISVNSQQQKLHRYIYNLFNPSEKIDGLFICHTCDNPGCINPKHLFVGTALDNNKDRSTKGRNSKVGNKGNCKGIKNGRAKLTNWDILFIKMWIKLGYSCNIIALNFKVHNSSIHRIKNGARWSHVILGGDANE
jgi:hypothetical protein